jgi:hypothetical protein
MDLAPPLIGVNLRVANRIAGVHCISYLPPVYSSCGEAKKGTEIKNLICCTPKSFPREELVKAAKTAVAINPLKHASAHQLLAADSDFQPTAERIAVMTLKYWGMGGLDIDPTDYEFAASIYPKK